MNLEDADKNNARRAVRGIDFFRGFLRSPEQVGSIIPSSRFLERRLIDMAGLAEARCVVELGPGTGGTTRAILEAMRPDARLLTIELDPQFSAILEEIGDPRLAPHTGSAADLQAILDQHGLPAPDVVVSGIPFSTMPNEVGTAIIEAIRDSLAPEGKFLAYQFRGHVRRLGEPILGQPEVALEVLNVPPMRFYRWRKNGA
ncbi:MAG: methyltransferase type 12 [Wenzhouxiangella sp.]|nr:MAG: methyltransferase type 12 [Wenzhouxiangella sp.]